MSDALLAAALLAVDPAGTGGAAVRGPWGPARDDWLAALTALLPEGTPLRRLPPGVTDDRLLGGLDLAATLRARRPVVERGLLAEADGGIVLVPMAERLSPASVARLTATLDTGSVVVERDGIAARHPARLAVVAFDEGIGEDERLAPPLVDRLAFAIDLAAGEADDPGAGLAWSRDGVAAARDSLAEVTADEAVATALCETATALGIASIRAPLLALRVARAHAALRGATRIDEGDAAVAARLVLAPRATRLPAEEPPREDAPPQETASPPQADDSTNDSNDSMDDSGDDSTNESGDSMPGEPPPLADLVLAAARAAIPPHLLASLRASSVAASRPSPAAGRAGAPKRGTGRGRAVGTRAGRPDGRARLNVLETLRAAAPWQGLRGATDPRTGRLEIRADDFRLTRVKQRTASTTIFVVDASGSAALSRLAEAKGAVELLLADCYVRRDEVALIAFRGTAAEVVVPPTRSLVRAKRCLAGLPGGGATPLAAAIDLAGAMARAVVRKGQSANVVFLTDGKANMTRAGRPGSAEAEREAGAAARLFRAGGSTALVVDTSPRPRPQSEQLAREMGARYLPLPYAGSHELSSAIQASTRQS
ncbi:MAG: magnesium chelatase subunit D [Proteobacteria bacterium]|nr:magnesium chelatase subunit D [Pseudomonadota bacterium]